MLIKVVRFRGVSDDSRFSFSTYLPKIYNHHHTFLYYASDYTQNIWIKTLKYSSNRVCMKM